MENFIQEIINTKKHTHRKFKNIKLNSKEHSSIILNFIYSCAALRSLNFKLTPMKKYKVEHMALKVTPTIDMVNSMISANSVISLIRYFTGCAKTKFKPMKMSPSMGTFHFDYRGEQKEDEEHQINDLELEKNSSNHFSAKAITENDIDPTLYFGGSVGNHSGNGDNKNIKWAEMKLLMSNSDSLKK